MQQNIAGMQKIFRVCKNCRVCLEQILLRMQKNAATCTPALTISYHKASRDRLKRQCHELIIVYLKRVTSNRDLNNLFNSC